MIDHGIVIKKTQLLAIQMRTEVNIYESLVSMLKQYMYEIGTNALIIKEQYKIISYK